MGLQPAKQDVCTRLSKLCTHTIINVKIQLEIQKKLDEDAVKKLADAKMEEQVRLLAEWEAIAEM
jgi:hypothetical protein